MSQATIKKWRPKYEQIVRLSASGVPNTVLAKQFNLTTVRISQIIRDPHAQYIMREIARNIRDKHKESIEDRLVDLSVEAIERLETTIYHDGFQLGSDAKKHQDNLSIQVLKGTGILSGEKDQGRDTRPPLSESLATRLVSALENSNEADRLNKAPVIKAEPIVDGDFVVSED